MKQIEKIELKPELWKSRLGFPHESGQCSQEVEGEGVWSQWRAVSSSALDVEGVLYTLCCSYVGSKDRNEGKEKSLLRLNTLVLIAKNNGSWQGLWQQVEP